MAPSLLPLNSHFTAYQLLLPLQGREIVVGLHNVPSPMDTRKSLRHAKLECDSELRALLAGFEHVIQDRLNQSMDVATFVDELKDILERIVLTQPPVILPPASFYASLFLEIERIGWEQVALLAPNLTSLHLRFFDESQREHVVQVQLPADYPEKEPVATADFPIAVDLQWRPGGSMKDILSRFELVARQYQEFWTVMEDIDKNVWVMEPENPSRANCYRRIALGGHCSLCITVDPLSPRSLPEYRFFGSDSAVGPLQTRMDNYMNCWKVEMLVRENLEAVLGLTFPSPQDADRDDVQCNKGSLQTVFVDESQLGAGDYCTYLLNIINKLFVISPGGLTSTGNATGEEGSVPDRVCDNISCGRPFHTLCLVEWLQSVPTTRQSFNVLFGACPQCSHPIMVKCCFG